MLKLVKDDLKMQDSNLTIRYLDYSQIYDSNGKKSYSLEDIDEQV